MNVHKNAPFFRHVLQQYFFTTFQKMKRYRYLARTPFIHGSSDGSEFKVIEGSSWNRIKTHLTVLLFSLIQVDGVSDKQYPVMLPWRRPARVSRVKPGIHGSGDLTGLPQHDLSSPVSRFEGLEDDLRKGSDTLRKVKSLRFGRNRDLMERTQKEYRSEGQTNISFFDSFIAQYYIHLAQAPSSAPQAGRGVAGGAHRQEDRHHQGRAEEPGRSGELRGEPHAQTRAQAVGE